MAAMTRADSCQRREVPVSSTGCRAQALPGALPALQRMLPWRSPTRCTTTPAPKSTSLGLFPSNLLNTLKQLTLSEKLSYVGRWVWDSVLCHRGHAVLTNGGRKRDFGVFFVLIYIYLEDRDSQTERPLSCWFPKCPRQRDWPV